MLDDNQQDPITTTKLNANLINPPDNMVESGGPSQTDIVQRPIGGRPHAEVVAQINSHAAEQDRRMVDKITAKHPEVAQMIAEAQEAQRARDVARDRDARELQDVRADLGRVTHERAHHSPRTQEDPVHRQTREYTQPVHHTRAESPQHHPAPTAEQHHSRPGRDYKEMTRNAGLMVLNIVSQSLGGEPMRRPEPTRTHYVKAETSSHDKTASQPRKRDLRGAAKTVGLGILSFVSQAVGGEPMKRDHR